MSKLEVSTNRRHLLRHGRPFFYLADTVWAAFANLSIERWQEYLDFRRAQGFSAVQISILPITHDTSTSPSNDDPFEKDASGNWLFGRLNQAYFDKAEQMVAMAVEADILPVLGMLWCCYVPGTWACDRSPVPTAMSLDEVEAYARFAATRFAPHEPAYFISGDTSWSSESEPVYYRQALAAVRQLSPASLVTMHMTPSGELPDEFAESVDFYMYQSGHGPEQTTPYELGRSFSSHPVRRPVVNGEPCYEGHGRVGTRTRFRAFDVRKATWQSLLSGASMGATYGGHGVWSCHFSGMGFVDPTRKFMPYPWEEALRLPGAWDAAFARWLWETHALWDVEPTDLVEGDDPEVVAAATADRRVAVVYMPHAYDIRLKMSLSGYRCEVFDLEHRRPLTPEVEAGSTSTVRTALSNTDALLVARKPVACSTE